MAPPVSTGLPQSIPERLTPTASFCARLEPIGTIATRGVRSRPGCTEVRVRRLLEAKIGFVPHPSFDDPAARTEILGPMPEPADGKAPCRTKAPKGLPPDLADLYDIPLLSREQEVHLFRKMNYLKFLANQLRDQVEPCGARAPDLDAIERLQEE